MRNFLQGGFSRIRNMHPGPADPIPYPYQPKEKLNYTFSTKFQYTVLSKMLKITSDANEKEKKHFSQIFYLLLNLG
jgi:hypothetical protein